MDNASEVKKKTVSPSKAASEDHKEKLVNTLKAYRTARAAAEKFPPYYVLNNEEMERIIAARTGAGISNCLGQLKSYLSTSSTC